MGLGCFDQVPKTRIARLGRASKWVAFDVELNAWIVVC